MKIAKKLSYFLSASVALVWLVSAGMSLAQDAPAPGAAEPAKIEAPAAPAPPRRRRRIRGRHRRSLPRGFWSRSAGPRWQRIRCGR